MIVKINLHPERKAKVKSSPLTNVSVVLGAVLIVELLGCIFLYNKLEEEVKTLARQESQLTADRDSIKERLKEVDKIKSQIEEQHNREITFAKLASLRTGPQYVLNELSRLLSNPSATNKQLKKLADDGEWSLSWDPENIIITKFLDAGENELVIEGVANTMDDVTEFWKRLKTSPLITNVAAPEIHGNTNSSLGGITTQQFTFTTNVNWNYQTQDGAALVKMLTSNDDESDESTAQGADAPAAAQ